MLLFAVVVSFDQQLFALPPLLCVIASNNIQLFAGEEHLPKAGKVKSRKGGKIGHTYYLPVSYLRKGQVIIPHLRDKGIAIVTIF